MYDQPAIITQHVFLRRALGQRIADLPPFGGRREREPVRQSPPCYMQVIHVGPAWRECFFMRTAFAVRIKRRRRDASCVARGEKAPGGIWRCQMPPGAFFRGAFAPRSRRRRLPRILMRGKKRGTANAVLVLSVTQAEGFAVHTLRLGRIHLMGADRNLFQRAEVVLAGVMCALLYGAADAVIRFFRMIHVSSLLKRIARTAGTVRAYHQYAPISAFYYRNFLIA